MAWPPGVLIRVLPQRSAVTVLVARVQARHHLAHPFTIYISPRRRRRQTDRNRPKHDPCLDLHYEFSRIPLNTSVIPFDLRRQLAIDPTNYPSPLCAASIIKPSILLFFSTSHVPRMPPSQRIFTDISSFSHPSSKSSRARTITRYRHLLLLEDSLHLVLTRYADFPLSESSAHNTFLPLTATATTIITTCPSSRPCFSFGPDEKMELYTAFVTKSNLMEYTVTS